MARAPAFAHANIRSLPQWGHGEAQIKRMIITLRTGETTITRDTWKAGMIREHNELGGPTSTNLSRTLFALFLAMAVVGAFFLAFGH